MFRSSRFSVFGAVFLGIAALSACTPKVSTSGGQRPATPTGPVNTVALDQPVTIALLTPASSSNQGAAALGKAIANAARMAEADLGDPLIRLQVYDTAGDANRARAMAQRALQDGAKLILGPLFANNASAIARQADQAGVKVVSFSTNSAIAGDPIYLSGFLPEMEAQRITSFARARGLGAMGVFYPDNPTGRAAANGASSGAGNVVASTPYQRTAEGIAAGAATFAGAARAAGAQAVLLPDAGQGLAVVAGALKQNGLSAQQTKYLGIGGWNSRSTLDAKVVRSGWFPAPDPAAMKQFVVKYQGKYGSVPPILSVLGYDAMQIAGQLLATARREGNATPFTARELTRPQGFRGAVGPIRFNPNGIAQRGLAILEVDRSIFKVVDPAPVGFGAGS